MPALATKLGETIDSAIGLSRTGESIRNNPVYPGIRRELTSARMELLYEMSYLRLFSAWEGFVEETLLRMLCDYRSRLYTPSFQPGITRFTDLAAARASLFRGRPYLLWYDPDDIQKRCRHYLTGSPQESVATSNKARLQWFAAIRHGIAHNAPDAMGKVDTASMALAGRRFPGSRPGKLLAAPDPSTNLRFLYSIAAEFRNLSLQIAP